MRAALALAFALVTTGAGAFPVERCVYLSNFLEVQRDDVWVYDFEASHIDRIAEAGFDTLRLPVRIGDWWADGRIDPRFRHLMVDVVGRARAAGLTVIVDLHHYERFLKGVDVYDDEFVDIWTALAALFDPDDGLIFELLNEPTDQNVTANLLPHYARAIAAIRARHPEAWIIYGGAVWNSLDEMLALPQNSDPRVVHTFHYYDPFAFTHQQAAWIRPPMPEARWGTDADRARIRADFARAGDHHSPTFLGEFGVYEAAPGEDRLAWIETVRRTADAEGIPWCHWGFGSGFGLFEPENDTWDLPALNAVLGD